MNVTKKCLSVSRCLYTSLLPLCLSPAACLQVCRLSVCLLRLIYLSPVACLLVCCLSVSLLRPVCCPSVSYSLSASLSVSYSLSASLSVCFLRPVSNLSDCIPQSSCLYAAHLSATCGLSFILLPVCLSPAVFLPCCWISVCLLWPVCHSVSQLPVCLSFFGRPVC